MKEPNLEKLALNWEGSYHTAAMTKIGAYYLKDLKERPFPRPWNVSNLKINF